MGAFLQIGYIVDSLTGLRLLFCKCRSQQLSSYRIFSLSAVGHVKARLKGAVHVYLHIFVPWAVFNGCTYRSQSGLLATKSHKLEVKFIIYH